jgi:pimeloyl-ACP methyl ester carboxylesterase
MKKKTLILLLMLAAVKLPAQCVPSYGFTAKQVQVDSLQINYVEAGKGETLLMIHGLGGNASHWKRNIETLSKKFRCIAVDLPGYGSSSKVERAEANTQLDFYADIIASLLKKLKIPTAVIMGHSMGGQVSMILALKYPALVNKLVLVAPAGLETFTATEANVLTGYATTAFYMAQDSAAIAKSYHANFFRVPDAADVLVNERIALKQCAGFEAYCRQIPMGVKGMLAHPVAAELQKIGQPVLVLFGEQDALIPNKFLHPSLTVTTVAAMAKSIPGSSIQMIPEAGHLLQYEKPEAVNEAVIHFLQTKQSGF